MVYTVTEVRALTPFRETVEKRASLPDLRDVFLCHAWDDRSGVAKELNDLLESQNDFLSLQVGYDVLRLVLDFELGTMKVDANGLWIDPGPMTHAALTARTPRWTPVAPRETSQQTEPLQLSHHEPSLTAR